MKGEFYYSDRNFKEVKGVNMERLTGKQLAVQEKQALQARVAVLRKAGISPKVAGIVMADDETSQHYFQVNRRLAGRLGIEYEIHQVPATADTAHMLTLIASVNHDPLVHGIMLGIPLPNHLDQARIVQAIDPKKDLDGLHPENLGLLVRGEPRIVPNTARAVMRLLSEYQVPIEGKHAVIVGRSSIVGKPLSLLLLNENATVTITHSRTAQLTHLTRSADILCVAVGRPHFITGDMVKPGAVVIDVGTNYDDAGHVRGDVDADSVKEVARALSPVPGGVGPVTNVMLFDQLITRLERKV
ncbi:MAG: bifunctional 5,10-methylenetetrahydrofolate dehydrogenase/5,10-methenyltetrahydrofolate cyclohydrolase [Aerococcus sp.]|nr:bifunctional 5,10-methylenetetrahydrofolate dehydrogenase/5,10-methenyltetrahydrofolate cyclohydrolase [Aerococcus sp.]